MFGGFKIQRRRRARTSKFGGSVLGKIKGFLSRGLPLVNRGLKASGVLGRLLPAPLNSIARHFGYRRRRRVGRPLRRRRVGLRRRRVHRVRRGGFLGPLMGVAASALAPRLLSRVGLRRRRVRRVRRVRRGGIIGLMPHPFRMPARTMGMRRRRRRVRVRRGGSILGSLGSMLAGRVINRLADKVGLRRKRYRRMRL